MRKILPYYFLLFFCATLHGQACWVGDHFHNLELSERLESKTQALQGTDISLSRSKIEIPIVVHVVWRREEANISEEQIHSQIAVLNRDFQLLNEDTVQVDSAFKDIIGNAEFSFKLTEVDEDGQPTSGITRTKTEIENIGSPRFDPLLIHYTESGGKDAWDTKKFLNIWVCEMPIPFIGYGSRPGERNEWEDGIIVDYRRFGTLGTAEIPNHLGRTATHEIGHYFNLLHLSGIKENCEEDDGVLDTPLQANNYFDCPDSIEMTCGSIDLTDNFMNFVNDDCMVMFTKGQVERMKIALMEARVELLGPPSSTTQLQADNQKIDVFPNPSNYSVTIAFTNQNKEKPYTLTNSKGQLVQEGIFRETVNHLKVAHLPKGLYWITINANQRLLTKKLLLH